jgi:tetratricopeptide (TPR) repeat protein
MKKAFIINLALHWQKFQLTKNCIIVSFCKSFLFKEKCLTMKNIFSFLLLTIFINAAVLAGGLKADSLFNAANQSYSFKQYSISINTYEKLINSGYKTSEIYFNLGNSYYKTGNYSRAILNYERAKILDPGNEDIAFNLAKASTYIIDKIDVIPDFFIKTWFKSIVGILSPDNWAVLALTAFFIATGACLLFFLVAKTKYKKTLLYLAGILAVTSMTSLVFAHKTKAYIESSNSAIVLEPTATVKSSPDTESQDAFIIHEGTKVLIIRTLSGWTEIKLSDGKQGWIEALSIEKI